MTSSRKLSTNSAEPRSTTPQLTVRRMARRRRLSSKARAKSWRLLRREKYLRARTTRSTTTKRRASLTTLAVRLLREARVTWSETTGRPRRSLTKKPSEWLATGGMAMEAVAVAFTKTVEVAVWEASKEVMEEVAAEATGEAIEEAMEVRMETESSVVEVMEALEAEVLKALTTAGAEAEEDTGASVAEEV